MMFGRSNVVASRLFAVLPNPNICRPFLLRLFSASPPPPPPPPPSHKQFEAWTSLLRPGFTASEVSDALRSQSDPDVAVDLFRWTACQRNYRHSSAVYHSLLHILLTNRRHSQAEALMEEILSGGCEDTPTVALLNDVVRFCCSRRHLFTRAFDVLQHMRRLGGACKPDIGTYSMLLRVLVKRLDKYGVSLAYMHSVRSLVRQMRSSGVVLDTYATNLIVKAHARCKEMDEAVRVYKEMGLYGCHPNEYTFGYLAKGMCEKGRLEEGMGFFREMRERGLVPTARVYMAIVNSFAMRRSFDVALEVLMDMVGNSVFPDFLTCRTLLEGLCADGREEEAFGLLEELKRRRCVNERTYAKLLEYSSSSSSSSR